MKGSHYQQQEGLIQKSIYPSSPEKLSIVGILVFILHDYPLLRWSPVFESMALSPSCMAAI
jgi:hypothetical protein